MAHPLYYEGEHSCCSSKIHLAKGESAAFIPLNESLIRQIWDDRKLDYNYEHFQATSQILRDAIARGWSKKTPIKLAKQNPFDLGFDFGSPDHETLQMFELNTYRFAAAKTSSMVYDLNTLAKNADSFSDFRKNASNLTKLYNERYLQTEYNYAWKQSQNSAQYHRNMAQVKNFPIWQYKTNGGPNVREAHAALHNMKFKATDPVWNSILPQNGWGCNCGIKTLRSGKVSEGKEAIKKLQTSGIDKKGLSEWDRMVKGGFNNNTAISKEIFDLNKTYLKNDIGENLSWKNQGLKAYKEIQKSKLTELKSVGKTREEALAWAKKNQMLTDHAKRKIEFSEKTAKKHLTPKYLAEGRQNLIAEIPNILKNADEVWMVSGRGEKISLRYIKYYKEIVLTAVAQIEGNKLRLNTWHQLDKDIDNRRTGILIKKL